MRVVRHVVEAAVPVGFAVELSENVTFTVNLAYWRLGRSAWPPDWHRRRDVFRVPIVRGINFGPFELQRISTKEELSHG